jgi:hypothetical protein
MKKVLTLVAVCVVIAVSVAFTMPGNKHSKSQAAAAKTESGAQTTGGFAFDPKD